jgi:RecB family exonuclease
MHFANGYKSAQKDYKVGEYQETAQERGERLHKDVERVVKESVKWCEEHPDTDPLDWLKPQTPEETEKGMREAFIKAQQTENWKETQKLIDEEDNDKNFKNSLDLIKEWREKNKPQNLTDLIYDWWEDVFTTHSDWDMETSIETLVDEISLWLPTEHDTNSYKWNQCIRMIREKLR